MAVLYLGLFLWIMGHLQKRFAPERRAAMGEKGRRAAALVIGLGLVLMILGYVQAPYVPVYTPWPGMGHANNGLMFVSVYMFGVGKSRGVLQAHVRHPMLTGVILWSVAHLLVNGDLASILLFGALGAWAVAEIVAINAAGPWDRPAPGRVRGDLVNLVVAAVLYALIAGVHIWLGHNPFLGTYG